MRLMKYISINNFRKYTIKLTNKNNENNVKEIIKKYNLNSNILESLDILNKNFKKNQRSNLFFDFCLENQGIDINKAKINEKIKNKFKLKCLTFNDELCKLQRKIERELKKEDFK